MQTDIIVQLPLSPHYRPRGWLYSTVTSFHEQKCVRPHNFILVPDIINLQPRNGHVIGWVTALGFACTVKLQ